MPPDAVAEAPSAEAIADSLGRLTAAWTPVRGLDPTVLTTARRALAASLVFGKTVADLHATPAETTLPVAAPDLHSHLLDLAQGVLDGPSAPMLAAVRSPLAAGVENPSGTPAWARGAAVINSLGPFHDINGLDHLVDLIPMTSSTTFAFGDTSAPFAVFPVESVFLPDSPAELAFGPGSVWFLAGRLSPDFSSGGFTGFTITGGRLVSTQALSLDGDVYVAPAGATLTLTATLAPSPPPDPGGAGIGDASTASFDPPPTVSIVFTQTTAAFQEVADSSATAYGSTVSLRWTGEQPTAAASVLPRPGVLVRCTASTGAFDYADVISDVFTPSGSAAITDAFWALPLAETDIATLPEAADPGAGLLSLGGGASLATEIASDPLPVAEWQLEIDSGLLYVTAGGGSPPPASTILRLWPLPSPSTLRASVEFTTHGEFHRFGLLASPTREVLVTTGAVVAHVDRPITAAGTRIPLRYDEARLRLDHSPTARTLEVFASRPENAEGSLTLALENALLGVRTPSFLVLAAALGDGVEVLECLLSITFKLVWLLPTLPDPYASTLDAASVIEEASGAQPETMGAVVTTTAWTGPSGHPTLGCALLPARQTSPGPVLASGANVFAAAAVLAEARRDYDRSQGSPRLIAPIALLDLSTKVDLFGVAIAPYVTGRAAEASMLRSDEAAANDGPSARGDGTPAPVVGLSGMSLAFNGAFVATFALPQVSWEPIESTVPQGQMSPDPPSDGPPLVVSVPNDQQLVPFVPALVLSGNIANVAAGLPFAAVFGLPFGLVAEIAEPNATLPAQYAARLGSPALFTAHGGVFDHLRPVFESVGTGPLAGGLALTLRPTDPTRPDASFGGRTEVSGGGHSNGYGAQVLGKAVASIFEDEFGSDGGGGVPLRRIDLSGYGASIFSEWVDEATDPAAPGVDKVHFETTLGRTAFEVIQVHSILYPYGVRVVRTVTMRRQNAGWVKRTDSGWQAASAGRFEVPAYAGRVHPGAFTGAFNVRNIRDQDSVVSANGFDFQEVLFDADLGLAESLKVRGGGFTAAVAGTYQPPSLVASANIVGYVQIAPDTPPGADDLAALIRDNGPFEPAIACTVEAGAFGGDPGTVLRCSAFEVAVIERDSGGGPTLAFGVALRGAPQIPRGGGWSMGLRRPNDPAPAALPNDFPVPLVQPAGNTDFWHVADVADLLDLAQPHARYSLLHATGTHKVLFESPQIPTSAAVDPPPSGAGLQFPKPAPTAGGGLPANPGSPNLGDLASILNSTGLFPDIASAISLLEGSAEQIKSIAQGFEYSKTHVFDPTEESVVLDAGVLKITLRYADTTAVGGPLPAELRYTVDSSAAPSWTLSLKPLSFLVTIPTFGSDPLLTITGGFYADEHTKAGLTNLNVQFGGALGIVKSVFSRLQALAQFLPGGAGANLDVALSDGRLTVTDTFTIGRLPLGLGDLTDISLDLGLAVGLAPLSVDFLVGIGAPDNPFNWIVSPLAGNGLMNLGVKGNSPRLVVQGGLGLGLAIDLGIASGSASVTIAIELDVNAPTVTLMAILTGQASVDVLDGLATASITLSAGLGFSVDPASPAIKLLTDPSGVPDGIEVGPEVVTLLATCSVGIHITVCWLVSVGWDGSWKFSQSITTPKITVGI